MGHYLLINIKGTPILRINSPVWLHMKLLLVPLQKFQMKPIKINYMKKSFLLGLLLSTCIIAQAGGLMTNTNYHIAFDRMMARGASFDIDAIFSNPAGLAWGHEGWQLSFNFQKPWQYRDIKNNGVLYEGKASAPIVPAVFASYKKDRWAISTMIGIVGSGGFVEYKNGVPMFNALIANTITQLTGGLSQAVGGAIPVITPDQFKLLFETMDRIAKAVPVGKNDFTYVPGKTEVSKVGNCTVTVKDFNINISGTLKLDAGNYSKSIDGRELLNDHAFMTEIKNKIMTSINEGINNGRYLSDLATTAGFSSPTSVYGKR